MSMDFTNLNFTCPKDGYLLPIIDELIDLTAGYPIMNFLDAFSNYHQIQIFRCTLITQKIVFIIGEWLNYYRVISFKMKCTRPTNGWLANSS